MNYDIDEAPYTSSRREFVDLSDNEIEQYFSLSSIQEQAYNTIRRKAVPLSLQQTVTFDKRHTGDFEVIRLDVTKSGTFYLSASRYNENSEEKGNHGYFTRSLLNALGWDETSRVIRTGGAYKDGRITFFDVAKYTTQNDGAKQAPMYSGGSNDLVLFSF